MGTNGYHLQSKPTTELRLLVPSNYLNFPKRFYFLLKALTIGDNLLHVYSIWQYIKLAWTVAWIHSRSRTFNAEQYTWMLIAEHRAEEWHGRNNS